LNDYYRFTDAWQRWGLDPFFCQTLAPVCENVATEDFDAVLVAVGRERLGKSTYMNRLLQFCAHELARCKGGKTSDYFSPKDRSLTTADFSASITEGKTGCCKMLDEAGDALYARESASGSNIGINKLLMTCGNKNDIIGLCLPGYFQLDSDVRFRRLLSVSNVYGIPHNIEGKWKIDRGYVNYYAGDDIFRIGQDPVTRQPIWPKNAPYQGLRFKGYDKTDPFWQEYKKTSDSRKNDIGDRITKSLRDREKAKRK
jgi:hypothetical protein